MEIKIQVGMARQSETSASYGCCVDLIFNDEGVAIAFARNVWFPKSICTYEVVPSKDPKKYMPTYFITCPEGFLKKNNIKF